MSCKSYILTVYISHNKNTKFDDQMQFFSQGSTRTSLEELWLLL